MRIPWYIVVIGVIGVILVSWHLRTRHLDFMTPANTSLPPEDFGEDLAVGAPIIQPKITDSPTIDHPVPPTHIEEPKISEITNADLGDLSSAPGLREYRAFAKNNPPLRLLELSSTLQARGDFQRALLSLERVVDTARNASPEELKQATDGIAALTPTLPRWSVDSASEYELTLHLSSSEEASEQIKLAALEIATLIRKHSGDQLNIEPKIRSGTNPGNLANPPLALWFSNGAPDGATTAVLTLKGHHEDLENELIKGVFQTVRSRLNGLGYPFPENMDSVPPNDLLTRHITRLMWHDFATSLLTTSENSSSDQN